MTGAASKPKRPPRKSGPEKLPLAPPSPSAPKPADCWGLSADGKSRVQHPGMVSERCQICGHVLTIEERHLVVAELLLGGVNVRQIQYDLSNRWHLSWRQIRTYLADVREDFKKQGKGLNRQLVRGVVWDRLEALFMDAKNNGDRRVMIHALREQAKIAGAYEKERIDLTTNDKPLEPAKVDAPTALATELAKVLKGRGEVK